MCSPLLGPNIVGIGEKVFREAIIILKGDLNIRGIPFLVKIYGLGMDTVPLLIEELDERNNAPFVEKLILSFTPLIDNPDEKPFVQER